jgi:multidrug efflux pump
VTVPGRPLSFSALFVARPVATTLLTLGIALAGAICYFLLPVAPLPQIDIPTIWVGAGMPGASPEVMAQTVATPLERHLGQIASVIGMNSTSTAGSTSLTLQFDFGRDADGAARDVQAAINGARADLPAALRTNPVYRKYNPASPPILLLAMTSATLTPSQIFDAATVVIQQKLSRVEGVGRVGVFGASAPAVRVELDPATLNKYGIGLEDVRAALASANANSPKGAVEEGERRYQIYTNDQVSRAEQYRSLIIAYRNRGAVRLSEVGEVFDSEENLRQSGLFNGSRAVLIDVRREQGANIIETANRVKALLPELRASIPAAITLAVVLDRTPTITGSLREVERSLLISVALVILVVFLFLRDSRATLVPTMTVPVSLIGTFAAMYLLGYSLNNISLMALTLSTGFVVDDVVVVLENTVRHREAGMSMRRAALSGVGEVGFTVLSMSLSLIAVFLPILLAGGLIGRFFREFAVTLSVAILISLLLSLSATPMLCSRLLRRADRPRRSLLSRCGERGFEALLDFYRRSLEAVLRRPRAAMLVLAAAVACNAYLFVTIPKGLVPQQDTGDLSGWILADQNISFQAMSAKLAEFAEIVREDPAVANIDAYTGAGGTNIGTMDIALKPLAERGVGADQVIARLREKMAEVVGAVCYLSVYQDFAIGGFGSGAQYQYTLQGDDIAELRLWTTRLVDELRRARAMADVSSDQQEGGSGIDLLIDRDTASRLELTPAQIDNTLYDAFGQRLVSAIYQPLNQYNVVMEVAPRFWQSPDILGEIYISAAGGSPRATQLTNPTTGAAARDLATNLLAAHGRGGASAGSAVSTARERMIPLAALAKFVPGKVPLVVNHVGNAVASIISFNLPPGGSPDDARRAVTDAVKAIRMPVAIRGSFGVTDKRTRQSLAAMPILILAAIAALYIVLGILYESFVHPLTILSTLPSAGVGALLALRLFGCEFSLIAFIGVLLLIGIVKKNAIIMVDFALDAARRRNLCARDAITEACLLRFRPIMMTTLVSLFGALPLALGGGEGAELRQPLGIAVIGGLLVSQSLTLYTTPVVYLCLDRLRRISPSPPADRA